ncbi:hypothetical protein SPHINGOAX6_70366 [Sphingomonas sp. AX6]|nr:hypothetical protein SPHINGOAX6_70366 [Sphingomonas sp. AX6]
MPEPAGLTPDRVMTLTNREKRRLNYAPVERATRRVVRPFAPALLASVRLAVCNPYAAIP